MIQIITLTRHTMTDWNAEGRIQGQTDRSLNHQGEEEARVLGRKLKSLGIGCIVSSDLARAVQTAELIAEFCPVTIMRDSRFRECSFGSVEGMTKDEAVHAHGEEILADWEDLYRAYNFCRFGGEYQGVVLQRHVDAFQNLTLLTTAENVLLVGHGRGLTTLLFALGNESVLHRGDFISLNYPDALARISH